MDLPDCPPGAEGYQDSVVEMPKKPEAGEPSCTKAEQEFQDHLNSLKIKLENGETRCMVERRGRDISGKWIYLCYPCGSVCSGESILQTHISGKKHKIKLSMRSTWPMSIFDDHPFNQNQKGGNSGSSATEKVLKKMAAAVEIHKQTPTDLNAKYNNYRDATCHIQDILDALKAPLVGVEYLIEHPPEMPHYEPTYMCTLCTKQGHPRTIVNHLTCFWHRYNYLLRHFPKACARLGPYKGVHKYREGVSITMNRLCQRIEDKFGRLKPVNIDKEEYEKEKEQILQWVFKGYHFSDQSGITLEEVVDAGLIESLAKSAEENKNAPPVKKKDPSPPVVAAPLKPHYNARQGRRERRVSMESLSDISDDDAKRSGNVRGDYRTNREKFERKPRFEPYSAAQHHDPEGFRSRFKPRNAPEAKNEEKPDKVVKYKVKLAEEKRLAAVESAATLLAYHEKNPEKHPLYPEEWKKFWNRRYKEIQAEGKDPSKHDFKPEWIVFWTKRMKELHEEELQIQVTEIYRKMNIPPPDMSKKEEPPKPEKRHYPEQKRKSPELRRKSPELRRKSPPPRRRSPEPRRRSPVWSARRSPDQRGHDARHRSPEVRRRSPDVRRSPDPRRRSPARRPDYRHERRITPDPRYSVDRRQTSEIRPSPAPAKRTRSRSPHSRRRSPSRTHITLESVHRSRSPLSRRDSELRNRSPLSRREVELPLRNRSPHASDRDRNLAPSMQTVMISDDELKPDDILSPWNSDNDIESISSAPRSRAGSLTSLRRSERPRHHSRHHDAQDLGPAENIVATLRVLVALEDYLGSLGPKIVDLLTDALKMEKERANSSEELLERESCVVLIETAKEKLKGAAQAGLVPAPAAPALRAAIVRAAATLHEADTRTRKKQAASAKAKAKAPASRAEAVPVAGVGEVDRAQIAQQMAAALIAQGKTDVTSEELAQLVDAVVGMAEAKKREAEATKKVEVKPAPEPLPPVKMSGTATALQMLQSAYDENDKKIEKEDAPDAMDGLSDSDLETLLKNFNELSAEEQHSLIAYLKKLEAREPQRVERLRQYVSAAATSTPPSVEDAPAQEKEVKAVTIESDDDDYTVEEVFKSATQKVKEDQIRKELDIVKKSLEENKEDDKPLPPVKAIPIVDLSKHLSSASDLFALVQASIKSTSAISPATNTQKLDVVASSTQPRSFGDMPEKPIESLAKPQVSTLAPIPAEPIAPFDTQDNSMRHPQNQVNIDRNYENEQFNQSESYNQPQQWNQRQMNNMPDNRGPPMRDQGFNNFDQGGSSLLGDPGQNQFGLNSNLVSNQFAQGSTQFVKGLNSGSNQFGQGQNPGTNQFGQGTNSGSNQFGQGPNSGPNQFGQGPNSGSNQFGQGPNSGSNQFGQGPNSGSNQFGQGTNSGSDQFGKGPSPGSNQFGQGPNSGSNQFGQGPSSGSNQFGQGPNSGSDQFGKGPSPGSNQFGQGPNSGSNQFGQGPNSGSDLFGKGPNPGSNQFGQGPNSGSNQFGQGPNSGPNQFGQGPHSGPNQFGQGPNSGSNQFGQGQNEDWQGNQGQNQNWQAPNQFNQGQNQYNQGQRGNMNGRMRDSFGTRPQPFDNMNQQQFGKYDNVSNNNFRGRGGARGNFGGAPRGRGRGRF